MTDIRISALKKGKKEEDIPSLGITDKYVADLGNGFLKEKDYVLMAAEDLKGSIPVKK